MIRERARAGLARAWAEGKRLGTAPTIPNAKERALREALRQGGGGIRKLPAKHKVGIGTVMRIRGAGDGAR
jgi:DNA invertase Pin-like site-specific DNA recombinase